MKYPPEIYDPAEVRALLAACGRGATGVRNRALIAIMYRAGLRCSEALALQYPRDIRIVSRKVDGKAVNVCTLSVRHGKGDKHRTVGIDDGALEILNRWIYARSGWEQAKASAFLFCTLEGAQMDTSYVRHLLKRLRSEAGLQKRVHAHGFRHSHAFELALEGVPPHVIQQILGHSTLAVTDRYLRHVGATAVIDVAAGRAPFQEVA